MKRIFIAVKIDPGNTLLNMISTFRTGLRNETIKWTETDNFHITMVFLGDTEEHKIKAVGKMSERVCMGSDEFEMVIKGAGVFKNSRDPRIIWTGIETSEKLNQLHDSIKLGMRETGITVEDRTFKPHLTLGRIKILNDQDALMSLIARFQDIEIQRQLISEVILYESILLPSGPVYKPLGRYPLRRTNALSHTNQS